MSSIKPEHILLFEFIIAFFEDSGDLQYVFVCKEL